jgi:hypothetical protein
MATQPGRTAQRGFKTFVIAPMGLTPILLALIIGGILFGSRAQSPRVFEPPPQFLPGNGLPEDAQCSWPPYGGDMILCRKLWDHGLMYMTYNVRKRVIIRTSLPISDQTLGGLILAWGTPTAVSRFTWAVQVHWGMKSVYVSARPFRPSNRTTFISYTLDSEDDTTFWRGFATWSQ